VADAKAPAGSCVARFRAFEMILRVIGHRAADDCVCVCVCVCVIA